MDTVIRSIVVYLVLLLIFRIAGKRSLAQITVFDFVLLLIIGEAIQQALLRNDHSLTNALLIVITLVGLDIGMSLLKQRSKTITKLLDSTPVVIMEDGKLLKDRMDRSRVDESDILNKAREFHGIERLDQIKYAVLERSGGITIVPKQQQG